MCNTCFKLIKDQYKHSELAIPKKSLFMAMDALKCPAMRLLEDLTPSGSEFYEDPERCHAHAKRVINQRMDLLVLKQKRINELLLPLKGDLDIILVSVNSDIIQIQRTCKHCLGAFKGTAHGTCGHCGRPQ